MTRKTEVLLFRWLQAHHFVILLAVSAMLAFICGYTISVADHIVSPLLPYISDTGTKAPASCVFGILLNISAVFGIITVYLRHRHLEEHSLVAHRHHVINDVGMLMGVLSCAGLMMVASFQWTAVLTPHMVGAFMVFALGNIYCWIMCYLTYVTHICVNVKLMTRVTLATVSSVAFALTFMFMSKAGEVKDYLHWKPSDPGYTYHLISTFAEWIMAISFLVFFLSFYNELKGIQSKIHVSVVNGGTT